MKKIMLVLVLIGWVILSHRDGLQAQEQFREKFSLELSLGPRIPLGVTKDDITTGIGIQAGIGYKPVNYFELFHFAFDFGNSTPHNPNSIVVRDYYSYYGRLAMETVTVLGFPLTTRLHFTIGKNLSGYVGGGGAYYWFSSRMEDPIYGNLQESRSRDGFGYLLETGIQTNFFSDKWLVMLKASWANLYTDGKSLSLKEGDNPTVREKRKDQYLTISAGVRYLLGQ